MKLWQYQGKVQPVVAETTSADKWVQPQSQPYRNLTQAKQAAAFLALVPSLFFTNTFPQVIGVPSNQDVTIVYQQQFQYQSRFETFQAALASETITVDKWYPGIVQPQPKVKHYEYTFPSTFLGADLNVLKDFSPTNKPYLVRKNLNYLYPSFVIDTKQLTLPEAVHADAIQQPTNQPTRNYNQQYQNYQRQIAWTPYFFADTQNFQKIEADAWQPLIQQPDRNYYFQTKYLDRQVAWTPSLFTDFTAANQIETVTMDKWFRPLETPYPALKHREFQFPSFFIDTKQLTLPERVTADKFVQPQSQPYPYVKHREFQFPSFFTDQLSLINPRFDWVQQTNQPTRRNPYNTWLYTSFFNDAFGGTVGIEVITVDKWYPGIVNPQPVIKHREFQFPSFWIDSKALTQPEAVTADKFVQPTNKPYIDLKRQQWTYPNHFFYPTPITGQGASFTPNHQLILDGPGPFLPTIPIGNPTLPYWTTLGRPATARLGTLGFNTETGNLEFWDGGNWKIITPL